MAKADQFGLWPQSVRTLDALLCMQIKGCLPFSNSNPQFKPTDIIMSAIARNRMRNWEIIADNLSKAVGAWATSQASIPTGRRFFARIANGWRAKNGQVLASNAKPCSACEFRLLP
jgi:hypothetical protein